jgi:UDP:flavonoid glycosyltransferase YjiC (YdhE family)
MRYLFCQLSSYGYIYPSIAVAEALRKRGHEVAFATGPDLADTLARYGFRRIPRDAAEDGPSFVTPVWRQPKEIMRQVKHTEYAIQQFNPDVLVGAALAFGPFIAAKRHNLPIAVLGLSNYLWPTRSTEDPPQTFFDKTVVDRYERALSAYKMVGSMFGVHINGVTYEDTPLLGDLHLLRTAPELEDDVNSLPERVHLVGDCTWEPEYSEHEEIKQWVQAAMQANKPIFYIQHENGSILEAIWAHLLDILGNKPVAVAASLIAGINGPTPPANFLVREHIPYSLVFPYTSGVIATGKTGVVLNATTHGLPMTLIVLGGSENVNSAERYERLGSAVVINALSLDDITYEVVASAVDRLMTDHSLRQNAQKLQTSLQRFGGPNRAADLLEEFGKTKKPILRRN